MARSKKRKSQPLAEDPVQAAPSAPEPAAPATPKAEQAQAPASPPTPQSVSTIAESRDDSPQLMKKGIYLSALIYIEGMQAPAEDFAALAKSALADALSGEHKGLTITLKRSHVENNVEDTEDSDESAGKKGGFEF